MANPYDEEGFGIGGGGDPNPYDETPAPASGTSPSTAMGQRGLLPGTTYPKQVQDVDAMKTTFSQPARWLAGAVGSIGDLDQTVRNAYEKWGRYPHSETSMPTSESVMNHMRGAVPEKVSDVVMHEPFTPAGTAVDLALGLAAPGISQFYGKGKRALEGGLTALDKGSKWLKDAKNTGYDLVKQAGIGYDPANWNALYARTLTNLGNDSVSGNVRSLVERLGSSKSIQRLGGNPVYFDEIEGFYKDAGKLLAKAPEGSNDARVLSNLRQELDDFRRNSPIVSGNMSGNEAMDIQTKAREFNQRFAKDRKLAAIEAKASTLPPSQRGDKVQQEVRALLLKEGRGMGPDELGRLQKAADTGLLQEVLGGGGWGHFAGRTLGGATVGAVGGYGAGDDFYSSTVGALLGGLGGAVAGRGVNRLAAHQRAKALQEARQMARVGPRRVQQLRDNQTSNPLLTALILGGVPSRLDDQQ